MQRRVLDTTLLFAALLGNFLAWCVHAFTWWLREKCLWLIGVCGLLAIGPFVCIAWFLQHFDMPVPGPNPPPGLTFTDAEIHRQMVAWFFLIGGFALLGCWHGWLLKNKGQTRYLFAVGAVFAETIAALFLSISTYTMAWSPHAWLLVVPYFKLSFLVSLLFLAFFRPLVVRYSQRFFRLIKPGS